MLVDLFFHDTRNGKSKTQHPVGDFKAWCEKSLCACLGWWLMMKFGMADE